MSLVSTGCCSRALSCAAAPSVAPGVGLAACLSVSVLEVAVWANAGVATATRPAESSHADLRIMSVSPPRARGPIGESYCRSAVNGSDCGSATTTLPHRCSNCATASALGGGGVALEITAAAAAVGCDLKPLLPPELDPRPEALPRLSRNPGRNELLAVAFVDHVARLHRTAAARAGKRAARHYFGASTISIWRPSMRGCASTLAISAVCS